MFPATSWASAVLSATIMTLMGLAALAGLSILARFSSMNPKTTGLPSTMSEFVLSSNSTLNASMLLRASGESRLI